MTPPDLTTGNLRKDKGANSVSQKGSYGHDIIANVQDMDTHDMFCN